MELGDFLKKDDVAKLADENVSKGDTFLMQMNAGDGAKKTRK